MRTFRIYKCKLCRAQFATRQTFRSSLLIPSQQDQDLHDCGNGGQGVAEMIGTITTEVELKTTADVHAAIERVWNQIKTENPT